MKVVLKSIPSPLPEPHHASRPASRHDTLGEKYTTQQVFSLSLSLSLSLIPFASLSFSPVSLLSVYLYFYVYFPLFSFALPFSLSFSLSLLTSISLLLSLFYL